jgi:hypothetical protein
VKTNENRAEVRRSRFYHLTNPIAPVNHDLKAKFDVLGSVSIVLLLIAAVYLMRLCLFGKP